MTGARPDHQTVVLFPGQGSQRVGMGGALLRDEQAREILEVVSDACDRDIGRLCAQGPTDQLTDTRWAQPAIFAVSAVAYRRLVGLGVRADLFAGHSIGELTALWAAGALTLEEAAGLVSDRGRLMGHLPRGGAMIAFQGLDEEQVVELAAGQLGDLDVALRNGPASWVLSGELQALVRGEAVLHEHGALQIRRLNTSHAFHSRMMTPAVAEWAKRVASAHILPPSRPVVMNHDGQPARDPASIARGLARQLDHCVRWHDVMRYCTRTAPVRFYAASDERSLVALARPYPTSGVHSFADPRALTSSISPQLADQAAFT